MAAMGVGDAILEGVKVARDGEVAAIVAAGEAELRLRIRSGASAYHYGTDGMTLEKSGDIDRGSAGSGLAGEKIAGAGVAEARGVDERGREDVRFLEGGDLRAQGEDVGAERVEGSDGEVVAVIDGVDAGERVTGGENVIDADGAEVFADGLQRAAEDFGDASEIRGGRAGDRPELQQRRDTSAQTDIYEGGGRRTGIGLGGNYLAGQEAVAGVVVGGESSGSLVEMVAEAFVVGEEEGFVALDGPAAGYSELIALKGRGVALIEEVGSIERVVAEEFENGAVPLIGAGLRDDGDLAAGALAVLGAVGIALHVEFADGFDAEKLAAGAAGLHIVFCGAGVFDAVEQEEILLRALTADGKIVAGG